LGNGDRDLQQLLDLVLQQRWTELTAHLVNPRYSVVACDLLPQLEKRADEAAQSGTRQDASQLYQAAIACATTVILNPAGSADPETPVTLYRLCEKLRAAMEHFAAQTLPEKTRDAEDPAPGVVEAPPSPVDVGDLIRHMEPLLSAGTRGAWWRLLSANRDRLLRRPIAEQLEALGDAHRDRDAWFAAHECYIAAAAARSPVEVRDREHGERLARKSDETMLAVVEQRIAHPVADEPPTDLHDPDDVWNLAESLALAGRFGCADELLLQLPSMQDGYPFRGFEQPGRFECIGDHVVGRYPEMARWFYERFADAAQSLPADTAYEGSQRDGVVQTARLKIERSSARLPRRVATVELILTGLGQGPRPTPEHFTKTVEDGGVLEIAPEGSLFTVQSGPDGTLEPIPKAELHRYCFRARIQGGELRLTQEPDQNGGMWPFATEGQFLWNFAATRPPLRLKAGKPVVIAYNVPGGGPQWTLTLAGIQIA
jgi:hypothetical protein